MQLKNKLIWLVLMLLAAALSGCGAGQAASPTPETVDVDAVMTSAAATAFVELTAIANQATSTPEPTLEPTVAPVSATETPAIPVEPLAATATVAPGQEVLPTATPEAAGLPATATLPVMAGTQVPTFTPLPPAAPAGSLGGPTCLNSIYVSDITVADGTTFKPGEKFTKIWRIQNTGTCTWDQGFGFVFAYGDTNMSGEPQYFSGNDQTIGPGSIIDLGVKMRAPYAPGDYYGHWSMIDDTNHLFGQAVMIYIKVVK